MSIRVPRGALRTTVAIASVAAAAAALSGCTSSLGRAAGEPAYTSSIQRSGESNLNQPMPTLQPVSAQQVATGPYVPPADIGGSTSSNAFTSPQQPIVSNAMPTVTSNDLPSLNSTNGTQAMSAQPQVTVSPRSPSLGNIPIVDSSVPQLAVVNSSPQTANPNAYRHTIQSGESLYTIARRYDVTAQSIVEANGLESPDKIYVGQKVIIPGRPDLLAAKSQTPVVGDEPTASPIATPVTPATTTAAIESPALLESTTAPVVNVRPPQASATQVAATQQPQLSGTGKFRWPVSGKVIVDFGASKGTGINIEAPEGTPVRAAENGTVIYVGSGVEGYGNLVLIRHANGYVSAYAHLKEVGVAKGANVSRGDNIGTTGMTGSVTRPQLHFELRMGATPVDPVPLLAS